MINTLSFFSTKNSKRIFPKFFSLKEYLIKQIRDGHHDQSLNVKN